MWSKKFWLDAAERAIRAAAAAALGTFTGTAATPGVPTSWEVTGIGAGVAALTSLGFSIAASKGANGSVEGTASLLPATKAAA